LQLASRKQPTNVMCTQINNVKCHCTTQTAALTSLTHLPMNSTKLQNLQCYGGAHSA